MAGRATVKPGESTTVSATLKTSGHVGVQSKSITVESSDPDMPEFQLLFAADIYAATPVPGAERTPQPSALFKAECAACHVPPADAKSPADVYNAACFMCHGALPGVPPPPGEALHSETIQPVGLRDAKVLASVIRDGLPQTEMPPFAKTWQGPLAEDQILALAEFVSRQPASLPRPVRVHPGGGPPSPETPKRGLPRIHPTVEGHTHGDASDAAHDHPH